MTPSTGRPGVTMAALSSNLFSLGVILVALGFAAHVGHAVMLANGRRLPPELAAAPPRRQPAYAGVVTGSFVTERDRAAATGPETFAAPSPLSRAAIGLTFVGWLALGARAASRAYVVGRGPWGNMFEFTRRLRVLDDRRLPVPPAALRRSARSGSSRSASRWRCCSTRRACRPRSSRSSRRSRTRRC